MTIYGYARISRPQQSIDRQIRNIKACNANAVIIQEAYTGTKMDRPKWIRLYSRVREGDTIIFDSVSRMSRMQKKDLLCMKNYSIGRFVLYF